MDMERALGSRALTPRQREVIALYYFACLTQQETADVLAISQPVVHAHLKSAIPTIAAHMQGVTCMAQQTVHDERHREDKRVIALGDFVEGATYNEPQWWIVSNAVWPEIRAVFGGPDDVEYVAPPSEYTILAQHARVYRREIPRPVIYPRFDNVGVTRDGEGRAIRLVRRDAA